MDFVYVIAREMGACWKFNSVVLSANTKLSFYAARKNVRILSFL